MLKILSSAAAFASKSRGRSVVMSSAFLVLEGVAWPIPRKQSLMVRTLRPWRPVSDTASSLRVTRPITSSKAAFSCSCFPAFFSANFSPARRFAFLASSLACCTSLQRFRTASETYRPELLLGLFSDWARKAEGSTLFFFADCCSLTTSWRCCAGTTLLLRKYSCAAERIGIDLSGAPTLARRRVYSFPCRGRRNADGFGDSDSGAVAELALSACRWEDAKVVVLNLAESCSLPWR